MKLSPFFKTCLPPWILLCGATLVFAGSFWLMVREWRHLQAERERWNVLQQEQHKVRRLETFAASLQNYDAFLRRLAEPREAFHKEEITLEPFGTFVEKLSRIYTDQGFFFLDSFELKTCEEKDRHGKEQPPCRPYAELQGKKIYFRP